MRGLGVDQNRAITLDHEQAHSLGQMGRESTCVVDGAASYDQAHVGSIRAAARAELLGRESGRDKRFEAVRSANDIEHASHDCGGVIVLGSENRSYPLCPQHISVGIGDDPANY